MKAKTKRRSLVIVAMLLLLATVIAMSGATFARYISSTGEQSNTATVAKWGFVISADASNLFGTSYKGTGLATTAGNGTVNVEASTNTTGNVVAPGTTGSMSFSISGQAEVRAKLTLDISGTDVYLSKTVDETTQTYNPIKWTLQKDGQATTVTNGTLADVIAYFEGQGTNLTEVVAPNSSFAKAGDYTLTWAWAFDTTGASGITDLTGNQADTLLGQAAHNGTLDGYTFNTNLSVSVNITVEQVQE